MVTIDYIMENFSDSYKLEEAKDDLGRTGFLHGGWGLWKLNPNPFCSNGVYHLSWKPEHDEKVVRSVAQIVLAGAAQVGRPRFLLGRRIFAKKRAAEVVDLADGLYYLVLYVSRCRIWHWRWWTWTKNTQIWRSRPCSSQLNAIQSIFCNFCYKMGKGFLAIRDFGDKCRELGSFSNRKRKYKLYSQTTSSWMWMWQLPLSPQARRTKACVYPNP